MDLSGVLATTSVDLDGYRDRLLALAYDHGQHSLADLLNTPVADIPGLAKPVEPALLDATALLLYDVIGRFEVSAYAIKVLGEAIEAANGSTGLADRMHDRIDHERAHEPPTDAIDLEPYLVMLRATHEAAISELETVE